MNPEPVPESPLPALPEGRFNGRSEFTDLIRRAFATAAAEGWREIIICDADFADWPLGERELTASLNQWSKTGRKLTMLARNYDEVQRKYARFVTWRRTWSHIVECRGIASMSADDMPSALLGSSWVFERLYRDRCIGIAGAEAARRVALRERLNECLSRSTPAFPATTLGL